MARFGRGKEHYRLIGTEDDPIPELEPCLLIRAQDEDAVLMALFYALIKRHLRRDPRVAESVEELAEEMAVWPTRKRADL
jgi:hypothetical protein